MTGDPTPLGQTLNGSCYRSRTFAAELAATATVHKRTRPYRPQPTARPSASTASCSTSGPTPISTPARPSGAPPCPAGFTTTTGHLGHIALDRPDWINALTLDMIVRMRTVLLANVADRLWREEYLLDALIGDYAKPVVVFMDGVTMGDGIGVGGHVSHRLVTERSVLAMPEVKLGIAVGGGVSHRTTWVIAPLPVLPAACFATVGSRSRHDQNLDR